MPDFIVAESMHQANVTATIDLGWKRIGEVEFQKPDGEKVRYLSRSHDLCGYRGDRIYLGYKWYKNQDLHDLIPIAQSLGFQTV